MSALKGSSLEAKVDSLDTRVEELYRMRGTDKKVKSTIFPYTFNGFGDILPGVRSTIFTGFCPVNLKAKTAFVNITTPSGAGVIIDITISMKGDIINHYTFSQMMDSGNGTINVNCSVSAGDMVQCFASCSSGASAVVTLLCEVQL